MPCSQAPDTDFCETFDPATADVIYVDTTVRNETSEALDLTCSYEIDHALIDDQTAASKTPERSMRSKAIRDATTSFSNPGFPSRCPTPTPFRPAAFTAWRYYNPNVDNAPEVTIPITSDSPAGLGVKGPRD